MRKKRKEKTIEGKIAVVSSGVGFLDRDNQESIYIPSHLLNTAFNGDEVKVVILPTVPDGRKEGEVIEITKRKKIDFVGTIIKKKKDKFAFLKPDDPKVYTDIFIPNTPAKVKDNQKALVRIKEWESHKKSPQGEVIKIIGYKGEIDAEMESIVIEKGFETGFSPEVEKEAQKIKEESQEIFKKEREKRRDFRDRLTFTIDPEDAKDFDDALSFKRINDDQFEIGVHIADVGFWVKEKSLIDKEAKKRGFSLYLVDRTIPMLPEILSNDICSLNPGEDKLTFSVIFKIKSNGDLEKTEFAKTIINSDKRFSYEEAQKAIKEKDYPELNRILDITKILRKRRVSDGSLDIGQEEVFIEIDNQGRPINISVKKQLETHSLIEELMVLANREVATRFSNKKNLSIYRVHEKPDRDSIKDLYQFLAKFGYRVKKENQQSRELNNLLRLIKDKPEEFLVKSVLIRSLPKAIYSIDNKGHFALALKNYTHFTSPIRRYADLEVHRFLAKDIRNIKRSKSQSGYYRKVAHDLNLRELEALSAERESIAYKQIEYMLGKIGNNYEGIITGVTEWGIYIAELETKAEGMVRLREMKDDYYILDKENFAIIGSRNKKRYSLGDKVKIKVLGGDLDKKILEYKFV